MGFFDKLFNKAKNTSQTTKTVDSKNTEINSELDLDMVVGGLNIPGAAREQVSAILARIPDYKDRLLTDKELHSMIDNLPVDDTYKKQLLDMFAPYKPKAWDLSPEESAYANSRTENDGAPTIDNSTKDHDVEQSL